MTALIHHAFEARARARPDAVALVHGPERLCYGELDRRSARLAVLLRAAGCRSGDRVGLLMPKSPMAIVAMLAVLRLGAIYVPLDPASPPARLAPMIRVCDCRFMLAGGTVERLLEDSVSQAALDVTPLIGWLDGRRWSGGVLTPRFDLDALHAQAPATLPAPGIGEHDPALLLFTSGSTGHPKGVTITHANVRAFLRWALPYFGLDASDRLSQHAPLRFDISTFDIYGALSVGAELHLVPPELNLLPHRLVDWMRDARLTQWFSVPSVLNLIARHDVLRERDLPSLRRVLFAGEVLPTPTLMYWMQRLPQAVFSNLYGPTETTIASSCYTVPRRRWARLEDIPIGTACAGEALHVLDEHMRPVADGVAGELYIGGAGLSPGYWRDADRTNAAFVVRAGGAGERLYRTGDRAVRDADGVFHYRGRSDTQVKTRGYRVELGEIERALHALSCISDGAVVAIESAGFEGALICCAFVPNPGETALPAAVRTGLAQLLPPYMLPSRWACLHSLPVNASGKVDRRRLQQSFVDAELGSRDGAAAVARSVPGVALRTTP